MFSHRTLPFIIPTGWQCSVPAETDSRERHIFDRGGGSVIPPACNEVSLLLYNIHFVIFDSFSNHFSHVLTELVPLIPEPNMAGGMMDGSADASDRWRWDSAVVGYGLTSVLSAAG